MNENLNLVEILKDCPKGTKLYSSVFGGVELDHIDIRANYPIVIRLKDLDVRECLTTEGMLFTEYDGECILFPSREERDWSKFKPIYEFKDGDIVATNSGTWIGITTGGHAHSYMPTYCVLSHNREVKLYFGRKERWGFNRIATEEEKQKLFQAIKDKGYKWNAETKTLEKLVKPKPKFKVGDKIVNRFCIYKGNIGRKGVISEITEDKYILNDGGYIHIKDQGFWELDNDKKQRFDPKTLQPFDKVLAKFGSYWRIEWFSNMYEYKGDIYYACLMSDYKECIPYNDGTKHLLGTSDEAPEYYRYWED